MTHFLAWRELRESQKYVESKSQHKISASTIPQSPRLGDIFVVYLALGIWRIPVQRVPFGRGYIDPRRVNNFLDTCAFDPKYSPEDEAAHEIRRLSEMEHVQLILAHSNQKEIEHPNTPAYVKAEAGSMIYTIETSLTPEEVTRKAMIHGALTGNGKPEKYAADASHVFEAGKYGGYFITTDERILAKRDEIRELGGGIVFRPSEWMNLFKETADA